MKFLFPLLFLFSVKAFAFPDLVRHGYVNCNACHASIVGGGLLNEYGRSLSREVLSQQSLFGVPATEGEEKFAYGLVKTPPWLLLQSDIRLLQTFVESKQASKGRFMIMQVDVDASAQATSWLRVFAAVGRVEPPPGSKAKDYVASPRHGVEFLLTSPESSQRMTVRAGRFMPAYGIGFAEHTLVTRRLLDFQPGQERVATEVAWSNDNTSVVATAIFAQTMNNSIQSEKGGVIQVARALGEKSKVGANYYQTQRDAGAGVFTRRVYGAFAHIGFSKTVYGLLDINRPQGADRKWGLVETFKLGYEIHQGFHLIGIQEYANLNSEKTDPKFDAFSAGVEWFPRPHWDLLALYRRERETSVSSDFRDVVWLVAHFYL